MGVIYGAGDDVGELLIPFARERGCSLPDSVITQIYTKCSLGNFTSAELWKQLGVAGSSRNLDNEYLQRHTLTAGLIPFLASVQQRGIPVGCISNDVSEWSRQLRRSFKLENYFFHWTISGDVRIRKPDAGIYQNFLKSTDVDPEHCVFVDDRVKNLDSAARLGFRTVYFSSTGTRSENGHPVVGGFKELEQRLQNWELRKGEFRSTN